MNDDSNFGSAEVFYNRFYESVTFGRGIGPKAIRRTHVSMEKDYAGASFEKCLELGAGKGQHLDFVKHDFKEFILLDIRKPELNSEREQDNRIHALVGNAELIPFPDGYFDRVISTCLLHHVEQPEAVVKELNRVLGGSGIATILLSCDPGLAVRTLRRITVARSSGKQGYSGYALMIAREHRNHVSSLLEIIKFTFRNRKVTIKYYPFALKSWNLNGYIIITIGTDFKH